MSIAALLNMSAVTQRTFDTFEKHGYILDSDLQELKRLLALVKEELDQNLLNDAARSLLREGIQ